LESRNVVVALCALAYSCTPAQAACANELALANPKKPMLSCLSSLTAAPPAEPGAEPGAATELPAVLEPEADVEPDPAAELGADVEPDSADELGADADAEPGAAAEIDPAEALELVDELDPLEVELEPHAAADRARPAAATARSLLVLLTWALL